MTQRERIVRAAQRIYEKEGMAGLSMRRVSARVRLTPMALYRHFDDKDALLDALVAEGFARFESYVARAAEEASAIDRFRAVLQQYIEFALANPRTFELMFLIPRVGIPAAPASLERSPSPAFTRIIASVEEAMRNGALAADDPGRTMLFSWSAIHGLIALHFSGRFGFDDAVFRGVASEQIDRLIRLLAAPASSSPPVSP
jgi:AcrR family transcriptional regulator